ncbi:hypothetical protein ACO2Q8_11890 [Larkinella sp. VNQ87]|uniref:hypothetical protein n=1 Tax=Larkinella sp. VNQ87 TaxID=3400921 RepID=UPI003C0AEBEF
MALTTDQLTAIDRHLRKENWLINEALIAELTDHYANGIEERLAAGMPFELALSDIHQSFGGRKGLLKMEEEFAAQAFQAPIDAFWKHLKTYAAWPKVLVPVLVFGFVFQGHGHPVLLERLMLAVGIVTGIRVCFVIYLFFRLNAWGKQSKLPFVRKISHINALSFWYFMLLNRLESGNAVWQCLFLAVWLMEFICTLDLLWSDQNFRKLVRLS